MALEYSCSVTEVKIYLKVCYLQGEKKAFNLGGSMFFLDLEFYEKPLS